MANKCYLEVYVPHTSLEGEIRRYWEDMKTHIYDRVSDISDSNEIIRLIAQYLPQYNEKGYPIKPYTIEENTMYVYGDELKFKFIIPDQFLDCFDENDELAKTVTKEMIDSDNVDFDNQFSAFWLKSTTGKAQGLLKERLEKSENNKEYVQFGNDTLEFLGKFPEDSKVVLFSGEILFDEAPEYVANLNSVKDLYSK